MYTITDFSTVARIRRALWTKREVTLEGCWQWTGSKNRDGYGVMRIGRSTWTVHRLAAMVFLGFDPTSHDRRRPICHRCNNKLCFHPDHIYIGTPKQNSDDLTNSGGRARGERTNTAKLTELQVKQIRERWLNGERQMDLALEYEVSKQHIWRLCHRYKGAWQHVF